MSPSKRYIAVYIRNRMCNWTFCYCKEPFKRLEEARKLSLNKHRRKKTHIGGDSKNKTKSSNAVNIQNLKSEDGKNKKCGSYKLVIKPTKRRDEKMYYGYSVPMPHPRYFCDSVLQAYYCQSKAVPFDALLLQVSDLMCLTKEQRTCPTRTGMRNGVDVMVEVAVNILLAIGALKYTRKGVSNYFSDCVTHAKLTVNYYKITEYGKSIIESGIKINDAYVKTFAKDCNDSSKTDSLKFWWGEDKDF